MTDYARLRCRCGQVQVTLEQAPFLVVGCCCDSCRMAEARLRHLSPDLPPLGQHGATHFALCRKDRLRFDAGANHLREFRLTPDATTRRVIAGCCNTPVFLEFLNGHWLSVYASLWPTAVAPVISMRTMTGDLPGPLAAALPDNATNCRRHSLSFFARLMGAWIAMGFRRPKITTVKGTIHV
jgi:hypothetical protein